MRKKKKVTKVKKVATCTFNEELELLMEQRSGGAINFRGINFQLLYAVYGALSWLEPGSEKQLHFEGLEDLDFILPETKEYTQIKTSVNTINASNFWELNILQNFLEVYKKAPIAKFRLVHNSNLAKGNLDVFGNSVLGKEKLQFWRNKFNAKGHTFTEEQLQDFFRRITVEKTTENKLQGEIVKLLLQRFEINNNSERAFENALFHQVFQWSKDRFTASFEDLNRIIQYVRDEYGKFPESPVLQYDWLTQVSYRADPGVKPDDYYEGKAARPVHIAMGLPVRRAGWENAILESLNRVSVTVIISSSGQGKSTLAWQVGQTISEQGNKVYRLNRCSEWGQATAIVDFIESRLKIGETPLIIVDGLDQSLAGWQDIALRAIDKPVKILITTRQEDWVLYGGDVSKATIELIPIKMNLQEAEAIFQGLQRMGKVHCEIKAWQSAWEQVQANGLLIEYVFLLTKGEMIQERLTFQVKQLQKDRGAAKSEILRLVSFADLLKIRLRTQRLSKHINDTVGFNGDRNEVYRQLEQEYYLNFDSFYIEGLHPVRSLCI